jgi:hypothetical protein
MDYGDWNMRGRIGTRGNRQFEVRARAGSHAVLSNLKIRRGQKRQEKKASAVQTEAP